MELKYQNNIINMIIDIELGNSDNSDILYRLLF
jgi:hypothetical protein